jgi:flavin reductase (DIM6/NTAB) family NADH-FMN oxidoreductase RutF
MEQRAAIDAQLFRKTLGRFATGVTVITVAHQGHVHGMTANAFMSVSLNPPLVLASIGHNAQMYRLLASESHYGVSILSEAQEKLSRHFGGRPISGLNIAFEQEHGAPLLEGALAHIVAKVVDIHQAGDHTLFIGEVEYLHEHHGNPLLFYSGSYGQIVNQHPAATEVEILGWMGF